MKTVIPSSGGVSKAFTYYVRDMQGNIMSTYIATIPTGTESPSFSQADVPIYGSSRIGTYKRRNTVDVAGFGSNNYGDRQYEITNHLGNVLATFSNLRDGNTVAVLSSHDYEPYGSALPYRGFEGDKYQFGFNGQEKDFDIIDGIYGAEYWEYDSRIGRRWNVDPVTNASISPYVCLLNNPICFTDPIGATSIGGYITNFFKKAGEIIRKGWNKMWGAGNGRVGHAGISFSFSKLYMKVAGFLRKTFTHAERALSLVPMWRMKTHETGWQQSNDDDGDGSIDYDIKNINVAMYWFKGIKVRGDFSGSTNPSFLIEDRFEHGFKRFIDWFIPFMSPGNNQNGTGTVVAFGGRTGLIPYVNTYLYGRMYEDIFVNQNMEDLGLCAALEKINSMFTMPYHRHTAHFRITTSPNIQYEFNIKYRAWTRYDKYDPKNSRPFWHKLLYGI